MLMTRAAGAICVIFLALLLVSSGHAQDERGFREPDMQGPFRVDMDRVVDGWRFNLRWREGPRSRRDGRFHLADVHTPSSTATDQECEREVGIAVRDFVRRYVRGRQLRARDVRRGRDPRAWVGRLEVGDEDLGTVLLDLNMAIPYHDSPRNPELREWDCSKNELLMQSLEGATAGQR
jgi:endonuclease YncB( thermonuclease family)